MNINPMQIIGQMMNNSQVMQNPLMKNAIEMYRQGDNKGLQEMAENLCKEKGTTIDEMKNNLMRQFGIK